MALTPPLLTSLLLASRASGTFPFAGAAFDLLAQGIANGVCAWGIYQPQNLALTGVATGTAGSGFVLPPASRLIVPPNVPAVLGALTAAGMNGPLGLALATVVSNGIAGTFTGYGQYGGMVAGVGVGGMRVGVGSGMGSGSFPVGTMSIIIKSITQERSMSQIRLE